MIKARTTIQDDLQDKVYNEFCKLSLEHKLVVYARFVHGNMFKAQNNDLFGLNRRSVSKIYRAFIDSIKENCSDQTNTTSIQSSK